MKKKTEAEEKPKEQECDATSRLRRTGVWGWIVCTPIESQAITDTKGLYKEADSTGNVDKRQRLLDAIHKEAQCGVQLVRRIVYFQSNIVVWLVGDIPFVVNVLVNVSPIEIPHIFSIIYKISEGFGWGICHNAEGHHIPHFCANTI